MGVNVSSAITVYVDNMGVVLNATNPGSTLNKKTVALAYHFVHEHQANSVIRIIHIDSMKNYADPLTKMLVSNEHHGFFYEYMTN